MRLAVVAKELVVRFEHLDEAVTGRWDKVARVDLLRVNIRQLNLQDKQRSADLGERVEDVGFLLEVGQIEHLLGTGQLQARSSVQRPTRLLRIVELPVLFLEPSVQTSRTSKVGDATRGLQRSRDQLDRMIRSHENEPRRLRRSRRVSSSTWR